MLVVDPSTRWTTTQTDGGCTFKWGNGSGAWAPGVGQQIGGGPPYGGFNVAASAKVTAIMCPAHTDGTQETMLISGLTFSGITGATVSKGLVYIQGLAANTYISNNDYFLCNTACLAWIIHDSCSKEEKDALKG